MKSNSRKAFSILLVLLLAISFAFNGCSKSNIDNTNASIGNTTIGKEMQQNDTTETTEASFSYPMEGKKTLTYWVRLDPELAQLTSNLADTPFGKALEERTGVIVKYQHPAANQHVESFNLLIASGDYPDIVEFYASGYNEGSEKAIADGFIIDLTDKLESFAPNLAKYYMGNPDTAKMAKTDSGKYYSFPFIRGGDSLMTFFGPIVRKDWLDDLGIAEPETMDDWYNMLKAFKEEKGASAPLTYEAALFSATNGI